MSDYEEAFTAAHARVPPDDGKLAMASWETIARRTAMIARGTVTTAEYQRMVMEKAAALQQSAIAIMTGQGEKAALRPWYKRATANARRLRRKT